MLNSTLLTGAGLPVTYRNDIPVTACTFCSTAFQGEGIEFPADFVCPGCAQSIAIAWTLRSSTVVAPEPTYLDDDPTGYRPNELVDRELNPQFAEEDRKRAEHRAARLAAGEDIAEVDDILVLVPGSDEGPVTSSVGVSRPPDIEGDIEKMFEERGVGPEPEIEDDHDETEVTVPPPSKVAASERKRR